MEDISIAVYTGEYQSSVIELILRIQRNEFGVPITLEQQPDLQSIPGFYQQGNGNFWVALHAGNVIGTIALIDIGHAQLALRKMFVHEAFRGKPHNVGQRLLDTAMQWMKQRQCASVFLGTLDRFVAARKFYFKNGFEEISKSSLPPNFPPMKLDTLFFKKEIEPEHGIAIFLYETQHQPWFEKLNRAWIEKYFWMEPVDFQVLQHPDEHIIKKGGFIFMASYGDEIAGTVALKFVSPGIYEFTKMAVDEKFQGKKIGKALAEVAIAQAKALSADKIILYSNTMLETAITLYRKLGFVEVPVDGPYKRSDIKMELNLW